MTKQLTTRELLKEVASRYETKKISRRDLLQLAEIDWCLECGNNGGLGERKIEQNGYCKSCNNK